jgi:hypothetical protein
MFGEKFIEKTRANFLYILQYCVDLTVFEIIITQWSERAELVPHAYVSSLVFSLLSDLSVFGIDLWLLNVGAPYIILLAVGANSN